MAVFNEPTQWDHELGNNADVSTLPDDTSATSGAASLQKLFQIINQTPLEAGGVAPEREDFNALFKILGDYIFFLQNGGVPAYNATYDYVIGRMVLYTDGNIYKCIQANGASSTVVAPDSVSPVGSDYWKRIDEPSAALIPNQLVISPTPLTDANLHLLDGALLSGSGVYADYVDLMQALYESDPTLECFTDEATWQASVTAYGVCGKFVWDSVNDTLRLPLITGFIEGTNTQSELGSLVEAGAPNITGRTGTECYSSGVTGAFYAEQYTCFRADAAGNYNGSTFDASRSSSVYGNSNTIQPQSIKQYFYIVVGTVSKTQIQIDIDNYIADLALKADTDLSNVPSSKGILVESYVNGTSWYRKYSDGWCEQGGITSIPNSVTPTNFSLLVNYINTDYSVIVTSNPTSVFNNNTFDPQVITKTTSYFSVVANVGNSNKLNWRACGYIS